MASPKTRVLVSAFGHCDLHKSIAAIAGLLTLPTLQANTLRLEAIAHLAMTNCNGRRTPTLKDASRWFKLVGKSVRHLEDPAEDVFVSRVIFCGENYRILEGLYEANGHHLQHVLHAVEGMPGRGELGAIKQGCRALLVLSDYLCSRAGLDAFLQGSEYPLDALPLKNIPTMKKLAAFATFSYGDLAAAGCSVRWLDRFVLPSDTRDLVWSPQGQSSLHRQPLLDTGIEIVAALPSALGAAIRELVIRTSIQTGNELTLRMELLRSQTKALSQNPMWCKAGISGAPVDLNRTLVPSPPIEMESGYWVHFVLLLDNFENFEDGGVSGISPCSTTAAPALQTEIEQASAYCRSQPGFKAGLSLVVTCGFGRTIAFSVTEARDWLVEPVSSYDFDTMGWLHDFDCSELFKLASMDRDLRAKGFEIRSAGGLLARLGFAKVNGGHLVQHEAMPDNFDGGIIQFPTNAHLEIRVAHHRRWDIRSIPTSEERTAVVRRKNDSEISREGSSRIYVAVEDIHRGALRGVWLLGSRTWWFHTSIEQSTDTGFLYRVWEMQCVWMDRIGPILDQALPSLPDFLVWRLNLATWEATSAVDVVPATQDEIESDVSSSFNSGSGAIVTKVGPAFYRGLSRSDNAAEAAMVRSFVEQALRLSGRTNQSVEMLVAEIAPSPDARQMHAFVPQDFRDHVVNAIPGQVVSISQFDDAALSIGLGWHGVGRKGCTLHGSTECTTVLNDIVTALEEEFCRELNRFERCALVEAAIANHEAAATDRSRWHRTARAIIGLAKDEATTRVRIAKQVAKLNIVSLSSRIVIEAGLCESPLGAGKIPADMDLSRLMAMAGAIFRLGGYSDSIHYGAMTPQVDISSTGQVLIDPAFDDMIVEPMGLSFADQQIDFHRERYSKLLQEPDRDDLSVEQLLDSEFLEAWTAEVGAPLANCLDAMGVLVNRLVDAGIGWEIMPRSSLVAYLKEYIQDPEAYVGALELIPRDGWKNVRAPLVEQDRQPWRYRRRLAVYRRPLLRLGTADNSPVLVAPGILQESLITMMHNYHGAEIDQELLTSKLMRRWWNKVQDGDARDFEEKVSTELQKLGWRVRSRKKFSEILGERLSIDPGDIDVLAWRPEGRIVVIECKNLQQAKTPSEIAKQLSKYRGRSDTNGRPDMLAKHLRRVEMARKHIGAFQKYTSLKRASVEGAIVFSRSVPMIFSEERIEIGERHLTVDQLSRL